MDPLFMHFVQELEEEERRKELKLERRRLRDQSNVFELPEKEFRSSFRLSKDLARNLIEELTPHMDAGDRNTKIPIVIRIMATLRFFAQGSYQRSVGNEANTGMAQQTFSRVLSEVCTALEAIAPHWIQFPETQRHKAQLKIDFMDRFGMPGTIGCIDCTHIAITKPVEDEHLYMNRKGYFSKNVQLICDSNLLILNVKANYGGATHDSFIWRNSAIKQHLEDNYNRGDRNSWLIGDSGYPQEPWLMTPIRDMPADSPEGRYTAALTRARNCIERCIGCLKNRFRCLLKERVLKYQPFKAGQIIIGACVLHNMCVKANLEMEDDNIQDDDEPILDGGNMNNIPELYLGQGQERRAHLINLYFN